MRPFLSFSFFLSCLFFFPVAALLTLPLLQLLSVAAARCADHVTKPLLDIVVVCYLLVRRAIRAQGAAGRRRRGALAAAASPLVLAAIVIGVSTAVLRRLSPPFGKQAAARSQVAGELRALHARVAANAEEIALLQGERMEEAHLANAYRNVARHEQVFAWGRLYFITAEQFFLKYVWSAAGNVMVRISPGVSHRLLFTRTIK